jgi:hypothetical protein
MQKGLVLHASQLLDTSEGTLTRFVLAPALGKLGALFRQENHAVYANCSEHSWLDQKETVVRSIKRAHQKQSASLLYLRLAAAYRVRDSVKVCRAQLIQVGWSCFVTARRIGAPTKDAERHH